MGYKRYVAERDGCVIRIEALYERDNGRCGICGGFIKLLGPVPTRKRATIDHIVPISRGGEHTWANVQLAHWGCNAGKSNRMDKV